MKSKNYLKAFFLCLLFILGIQGCKKEEDSVSEEKIKNDEKKELSGTDVPKIARSTGDWLCAAEAGNISLNSNILDALKTTLMNTSNVQGIVKTDKYLKYTTLYADDVYFILPVGSQSGRVVTVSRLPVYNIGMIKRLDNNLLEAARFYAKSVLSGYDESIFNIYGGISVRFYYTQVEKVYSRVYIDYSGNRVIDGYLTKPESSGSLGFRGAALKTSGCMASFTLQGVGQTIAEGISQDQDGFYMFEYTVLGNASGKYAYKIEFCCGDWLCNSTSAPTKFRKYWFECAGENQVNPVDLDVKGMLQPIIISKNISELVIPK